MKKTHTFAYCGQENELLPLHFDIMITLCVYFTTTFFPFRINTPCFIELTGIPIILYVLPLSSSLLSTESIPVVMFTGADISDSAP